MSDGPSEVLGVAPTADADEVRRAYLRLIRTHTPEQDPEGFKRVRAAYETLRSPLRRAELGVLSFDESVTEPDLDLVATLGDDEVDLVELVLAAERATSDLAETDFSRDLTPVREADLI